MIRIHAVAASAAVTVALAVAAVGAAAPTAVLAAARPAPGTSHAKGARTHAAPAKASSAKDGSNKRRASEKGDPVTIVSQFGDGKYLSVLTCHGVDTPPPIRLNAPGTPLTLTGTGPSAVETASLNKPKAYAEVYTCTIVLREKRLTATPTCELATGGPGGSAAACHQKITLNTGFGGEAASVALHHPRG
jgi:hypothetical protein